jgi:hypothetical protein
MSGPGSDNPAEADSPEVAAARAKIRRRRSIALGVALALFALVFYVLTIVRMGPALFDRTL